MSETLSNDYEQTHAAQNFDVSGAFIEDDISRTITGEELKKLREMIKVGEGVIEATATNEFVADTDVIGDRLLASANLDFRSTLENSQDAEDANTLDLLKHLPISSGV